jgi:hypothetical protein
MPHKALRADCGSSPQFPPRYRGAFERDRQIGTEREPGHDALSQAARDMLERKLGPDAASRMITVVERMAAAAAGDHAGQA